MSKYICPHCGADCVIRYGSDGKKFVECGSPTCTFNFKNISKEILGRYRRHFKLSATDYVTVHEMYEDYSIGYIAKHFGICIGQTRRILKLNLSNYAERIFGEKGLNNSNDNISFIENE